MGEQYMFTPDHKNELDLLFQKKKGIISEKNIRKYLCNLLKIK